MMAAAAAASSCCVSRSCISKEILFCKLKTGTGEETQAEEQEGAHRRKFRGGGQGRRHHYLSAPGRQAATFGGGGGAGGFELRYTKQKKRDKNNKMTDVNTGNHKKQQQNLH